MTCGLITEADCESPYYQWN